MAQKDMNALLSSIVGLLFATVVSLCIYIYLTDKASMDDHVQDSHVEVESTITKVDELSANIAANQIAMLEKIYGITMTSMNKINALQLSQAEARGNYKELSQKLDSAITQNLEFRTLVMSKLDKNEKRFIQLEKNDAIQDKNINTLAKDRGVRLFSASW